MVLHKICGCHFCPPIFDLTKRYQLFKSMIRSLFVWYEPHEKSIPNIFNGCCAWRWSDSATQGGVMSGHAELISKIPAMACHLLGINCSCLNLLTCRRAYSACSHWCSGAKAPGHQYPQCWINCHYIGPISLKNTNSYIWQKQHYKTKLDEWTARRQLKSPQSLSGRSIPLVTFEAWGSINMFAFRFVAIGPFLAEI